MKLCPLELRVAEVTAPLSTTWMELLKDPTWCRNRSWVDVLAAMPVKGDELLKQLCVAMDRLSSEAADFRAQDNPASREVDRFTSNLGTLLMTAVASSITGCEAIIKKYHRPVLDVAPRYRVQRAQSVTEEAARQRAAALYAGDVIDSIHLRSIFHTFHPTANGGALRSPNTGTVAAQQADAVMDSLAIDGVCKTKSEAATWLWKRLAYRADTQFEAALGFIRTVAANGVDLRAVPSWPLPEHEPYAAPAWQTAVQAHVSETAMQQVLAAPTEQVSTERGARRKRVQL